MDQSQLKRTAARAALEYLRDGITLGVGTGSTVSCFVEALAERGVRLDAVVSSSEATTQQLERVGIRPVELAQTGDLDLYVDGADEATSQRYLTKGGGGALTREKVLAAAARRFVCMVDDSKLVRTLGGFPLPIEVVPMARSFVARQLYKLGGQPEWREDYVTDNGGQILDVHNLSIPNPVEMEQRLNQIPGVITVGIFARRPADVLLVAGDDGVRKIG